jgi:ankyrin repeat protein
MPTWPTRGARLIDLAARDHHRVGWGDVHIAARVNDSAGILALAKRGISLCRPDDHGRTPAHIAAALGNTEALKALVRAGSPKLLSSICISTRSWKAHIFNGGDTSELLSADGVGQWFDFGGASPAHLAAAGGHLETLRYLYKVVGVERTSPPAQPRPADYARLADHVETFIFLAATDSVDSVHSGTADTTARAGEKSCSTSCSTRCSTFAEDVARGSISLLELAVTHCDIYTLRMLCELRLAGGGSRLRAIAAARGPEYLQIVRALDKKRANTLE